MADEDQVPFQIQARDPVTGEVRTTTGTGRRAPVQMPGVQPQGIVGAYQNLPVDQAQQVINAAIQYQAQRGYQKDIQSGLPAAQAFAKWGPMLFKTGTGMPEALKLTAPRPAPPPITPYQQQRLGLEQQRIANEQARAAATESHRDLTASQQEDLKDAYKELDTSRKEFDAATKIKAKDTARLRVASAQSRIKAITSGVNPATPAPATQQAKSANPYKVGAQYGNLKYKGGDPNDEANWEAVK